MTTPPLGLYVHWPYCARLCPYCDFNVVRDRGGEKGALVGALLADLAAHADLTGPRRLVSIFFGGGTPSLMDPGAVGQIIETASKLWPAAVDLEVTLEANPTDAEAHRFEALARAGVNRLSLGLQSLDDAALKFLGRNHDAATGRRAAARAAGAFPRLSLDLIYALPGQTPSAWAADLRAAMDLGAEHVSAYQLTLEPGTAFHRAAARGTLAVPGPDLAADLYETTAAVLEGAAFEAYEISNHARGEAARSRHNLGYWRGSDWIGIGPGAHGRLTLGAERFATLAPKGVTAYIAQVAAAGLGSAREPLEARAIALERLLMGLRTVEGVALIDLTPLRIPTARIEALEGFLTADDGRLTATAKGRPVLDRLIANLARGA